MNKIAILDFGSQYTHLIATRIRKLGVYSEIIDTEVPAEKLKEYGAIIISGGPESVYESDSSKVDPRLFELGKPVLGICYGHQLMTHMLGGTVEPGSGQGAEFGKAEIEITNPKGIFEDFVPHAKTQVWMSHGDRVTQLPDGFEILASSSDDPYSAVGDIKRNFYGIQFHTEVAHTMQGSQILSNFIKLAKIKNDWNLESFIDYSTEQIKGQVKNKNVFMLVSGGVDSTVAFSLLAKAIGQERIYGLFVDTGFMRDGEREQVESALKGIGISNLHVYDAKQDFLEALKGVYDPEKKREIIGRLFLDIQSMVTKQLNLDPEHWLLGQGTIYPDTIESGGTKKSAKIKTHHNRVPEIEELIKQGKVIEPLKDLYKDEVREVGEKLGLPHDMVWRHPFPGPGLAVRILCAEKEDVVKNAIDLEDILNNFVKLHNSTLCAKTLPIKSVGVQGDFRTYRHPLVLCGDTNWEELAKLAPAITNKFHEINRVLFLIAPKDPTTASLTPGDLNEKRIETLQRADKLAMNWLKKIGKDREVWQMPTVLLPISLDGPGSETIVLRPIISEEAMTAHFAELPIYKVKELANEILKDKKISAVLYDVTNKPPGTIEWE